MNILSEILRDLMARHGLTGAKLAEEIGLSATSVSQILTGKTKPRQVTLSRMMKRLCENSKDEQALLSAYETIRSARMPNSPILEDAENAETEEERVRRFMEMKAKAVAFRREVVAILDRINIPYRQDVASGAVITDLLIEHEGKRTALECRANVKRDLEKSLFSARIIRDGLKCDRVFIVVPEFNSDLRDACSSEDDIRDVELRHLATELSNYLSLQ